MLGDVHKSPGLPSKFCIYTSAYKPFKSSVEFTVHCVYSVSLLSVKIWMEGTYDMPYTNLNFFVTTEPNRMGFSIHNFEIYIES